MENMIFYAAFLSRGVSGDGTSPEYEPIQRVVAEKIYIFSLLATVCDTPLKGYYGYFCVALTTTTAKPKIS